VKLHGEGIIEASIEGNIKEMRVRGVIKMARSTHRPCAWSAARLKRNQKSNEMAKCRGILEIYRNLAKWRLALGVARN
jgi:hypothetical protein